jgi:Domain of unknown function (DUF397)
MAAQLWQQSSFCGEGNACLQVSDTAEGTIRVRESNDPDLTLSMARSRLRGLFTAIKADRLPGDSQS